MISNVVFYFWQVDKLKRDGWFALSAHVKWFELKEYGLWITYFHAQYYSNTFDIPSLPLLQHTCDAHERACLQQTMRIMWGVLAWPDYIDKQ